MTINNLPKKIAIFPLSNTIFFPHTILPLNIFEKKYIQIVGDSMKDQRLFGMVQPKTKQKNNSEVYNVGCLGKIISFDETEDNRFLINLSGIMRFKIKKELSTKKLYREFKVDYSDFIHDLDSKKIKKDYDIKNLLSNIKLFFSKKNYLIEFGELKKLNFNQLIIFILMGLLPIFVSGYIIFILPQYMLFGLLAVSLCILWGYSGIISFGQAAFFAIGAYTMGIVIREGGAINPAYIGIVCGALLSGIVALIVGYFLKRLQPQLLLQAYYEQSGMLYLEKHFHVS